MDLEDSVICGRRVTGFVCESGVLVCECERFSTDVTTGAK